MSELIDDYSAENHCTKSYQDVIAYLFPDDSIIFKQCHEAKIHMELHLAMK